MTGAAPSEGERELGPRLQREVLGPLKEAFVGKDEVVDLLGVALVARENLFLLGPPGTAKSALVHDLGRRLAGRTFDYLLTRFTEPNELFGPFDIRRLREGDLVTNTDGMLPEAELVFLDELLNANSAILNSLLTVLNERLFRRGRESRALPTLTVVGASNRLPEDEALAALFDRFLLRVASENVPDDRLGEVLDAGWRLDARSEAPPATLGVEEVRRLAALVPRVELAGAREPYMELVRRLRGAGFAVSDRRAVKLLRPVAASALLCGRLEARPADLWVVRHTWDTEEQVEVLEGIVGEVLARAPDAPDDHPRARGGRAPDPEGLAADLDRLADRASAEDTGDGERAALRDRLSAIAARCAWVSGAAQRRALEGRVEELWTTLGDA